jgi:hypothetical protein
VKLNQRWEYFIAERRFKQRQCRLKYRQEFAKEVVTSMLYCESVRTFSIRDFFSGRLPQAKNTGKALGTKSGPPPTGYHVFHCNEGVTKCANGTV